MFQFLKTPIVPKYLLVFDRKFESFIEFHGKFQNYMEGNKRSKKVMEGHMSERRVGVVWVVVIAFMTKQTEAFSLGLII